MGLSRGFAPSSRGVSRGVDKTQKSTTTHPYERALRDSWTSEQRRLRTAPDKKNPHTYIHTGQSIHTCIMYNTQITIGHCQISQNRYSLDLDLVAVPLDSWDSGFQCVSSTVVPLNNGPSDQRPPLKNVQFSNARNVPPLLTTPNERPPL